MPNFEEVYKILLELETKGDVKRAADEAKGLERQILALGEAHQSGTITSREYEGAARLLAGQLADLRAQMAAAKAPAAAAAEAVGEIADAAWLVAPATAAAAASATKFGAAASRAAHDAYDLVGASYDLIRSDVDDFYDSLGIKAEKAARSTKRLADSTREAGKGGRNLSMFVLEASRGIDDLQYSLGGFMNNLPNMLQYLGAGTGLVGVITMVGVGVSLLVRYWDGLMDAFGSTKTETAVEQMERLEKQTQRTAEQTALLRKLKKEDADAKGRDDKIDHADAQQSTAEKATAEAVEKAVTEGGGFKNVVGGMVDGMIAARKRDGEFRGADGGLDVEKMNSVRAVLTKQAEDLIFQAQESSDPKQQKTAINILRSMSKESGSAFGSGLDANLGAIERDKAVKKEEARNKRIDDAEEKSWDDLQRNLDAGKQRKAAAAEISGRLADGPLGVLAESGKLSDAAVRRAMKRDGRSQNEIDRLAPTVGDQLRQGGRNRVADYAAEHGITPAEARRRMSKERGDDEAKALGLDGPGLVDKHADVREAAAAMVAAHLQGGRDLDTATALTYRSVYASQGQAAARGTIAGARLDGQEQFEANRPRRTSQVIDSASVAEAVQAGVGGQKDDLKQANAELKKQSQTLLKIAENTAKRNALTLQK